MFDLDDIDTLSEFLTCYFNDYQDRMTLSEKLKMERWIDAVDELEILK